jgi:hypothetical protein
MVNGKEEYVRGELYELFDLLARVRFEAFDNDVGLLEVGNVLVDLSQNDFILRERIQELAASTTR